MSCCCGHGPCHYHHGYPYASTYAPPPVAYYPTPEPYGYGYSYGYGRRRRRRVEAEDLADYLQDLEAEVARVRRELDELRKTDTTES
jgi:hypothetical protein